MERSRYERLRREILSLAQSEGTKKGADYAHSNQEGDDTDQIWNFKAAGEIAGLMGLQDNPAAYAYMVYFIKHLLALASALKGKPLRGESLHSRGADLVNYAILGVALAEEVQGAGGQEEHPVETSTVTFGALRDWGSSRGLMINPPT